MKTHFDRDSDRQQVVETLQAGCTHVMKAFEIENINIDDLIETAMNDPQAVGASESREFHGINFGDLHAAYRLFCKRETIPPVVDLTEVIDFYNKAAADLPVFDKVKLRLPGVSVVLDGNGKAFADMPQDNRRSQWIALDKVPVHVRNAFIAAEDKRFYQHRGVDDRGLIRAFVNNLTQGHREGGSTITQQLVKNMLVGDNRTYERKIRETILATQVETALSKDEILELYLNSVYLGRGAWGIARAAHSYFGKPASDLTVEEGALLAGLTKGPNFFSPDRQPARAQGRLAYVVNRMQEDGMLSEAQANRLRGKSGVPALPAMTPVQHLRRDSGYYFTGEVAREVKAVAGVTETATDSYVIRSTINPQMQRAAEEALQEGLFRYERDNNRLEFKGAEANLTAAIEKIDLDRKSDADSRKSDTDRKSDADRKSVDKRPSWQVALMNARLPLYDVHWTPAVVVDISGRKNPVWRVGLADGRIVPLSLGAQAQHKIKLNDVVLVQLSGGKGKAARAELRVRPTVQGAALVLENKTGRILAMAGGFSYPLSQLNRVTQALRQPGSTIKPLTYLAALGKGLQPDTLLSDDEISLRIGGHGRHLHGHEDEYWTPKNYDGGGGGVLTMRSALENSRNRATVHLLDGGIERDPESSLNRICDLAVEALIYRECQRFYPVVLGAQPVRPVDLAAFYAAIANEGKRPLPFTVDSVERNGQVVYRHQPAPVAIRSVDPAAFYQLKSMLQGVVARGTAHSISRLSPYVGGKTGTTEDENDAWFIGFSNDVTVAVWLGYDNAAGGKRRTLGSGSTGGAVAVPVFEPIMEAAWSNVAPRRVLAPPSPQAKQELACSGGVGEMREGRRRSKASQSAVTDCLRVDRRGQVIDTKYRLVAEDAVQGRDDTPRSGRPAYAFDAQQGRWPFTVPWTGMSQWHPHFSIPRHPFVRWHRN
ncbi:MAG: transglycosylase domain-containing protein [Bradyrhizobiaceae bacterium]|nr:transglycosylase domain-containing protein [Bradyrhizobiaceae bacterium]